MVGLNAIDNFSSTNSHFIFPSIVGLNAIDAFPSTNSLSWPCVSCVFSLLGRGLLTTGHLHKSNYALLQFFYSILRQTMWESSVFCLLPKGSPTSFSSVKYIYLFFSFSSCHFRRHFYLSFVIILSIHLPTLTPNPLFRFHFFFRHFVLYPKNFHAFLKTSSMAHSTTIPYTTARIY